MRTSFAKWLAVAGISLAATLAAAPTANASVMSISSTGFDLRYSPDLSTPANSRLCDRQTCNGGNGTVGNADSLASMTFTRDPLGANQVIQQLLTNIYMDMNLTLAGYLQVGVPQAITGGYFDLFTKSTSPGWGLAVNVTSGNILLQPLFGSQYILTGGAIGQLCLTCTPNNSLPIPGTFLEPFSINFVSFLTVTPGFGPGQITTAFNANGTSTIEGTLVPEPASVALIGAAMMLLFGFGVLRQRRVN